MKAYDGKLIDIIAFAFKALFVVSLAVVVFGKVYAEPTGTVAYFENEAGGHVMLTNEPCHVRSESQWLYRAVGVSADKRQVDGCWVVFDKTRIVEVYWLENSQWAPRRYDVKEFTRTDLGRTAPVAHLLP